MKTFKTPKGTELPMLDMRGKDYLQVAWRLVWFREERPLWGIETEILSHDEKRSLVKATIKDETGRTISQATKQEDTAGFKDHLEKAETGAIGRALAHVGFGTQFAPDIDEGERIVDSPLSKHGESISAPNIADPAAYVVKVGQYAGKRVDQIPDISGWVGFHSMNKKLNGPMLEAIQMAQKFLDGKK